MGLQGAEDKQIYLSFISGCKKGCVENAAVNILKIYQPVSRILSPDKSGGLSFIWPTHYCMDLAAYPSASGEPPSSADIRGISAHKVYPVYALLQKPVSSYLTFSPLPSKASAKGGCPCLMPGRVVIFCGTVSSPHYCGEPALNRCVALSCPDFPHRYPENYRNGAITRLIGRKDRFYFSGRNSKK
jgi:hypothetical protein